MFQNNLLMAAASISTGALTVDNSVIFNDDDSPRLFHTPSVAGNRRIGSLSLWHKRCNLGSIMQLFNAGAGDDITFNASDKLTFSDSSGVSYITTQVFRDTTAWGHLLFAWDTTLAAAGDRLRIYHNGVEITAFDTETNPSQMDELEISNTVRQTIGANESDTEEFDGYLSQVYLVDGAQLTPTDFGEFTDDNVWRPIELNSSAVTTTETVATFTANQSVDQFGAGSSVYTNHGLRFTADKAGTVKFGRLNCGTVTTAVDVTMSVWTEDSGSPGSQIGGSSDELTVSTTGIKTLTWSSNYPTISASTLYWIVITDSSTSGNVGLMRRSSNTGFIHGCAAVITNIVSGSGVNTSYPIQLELGFEETGYGRNGFKLDFADSSDFGNDVSGNNNDYTSSGLVAADQVTDTPTKNYATLNTLANGRAGSGNTLSNGNLTIARTTTGWDLTCSTFAATKKTYWEVLVDQNYAFLMGLSRHDNTLGATSGPGGTYGAGLQTNEVFNQGGVADQTNGTSRTFPIVSGDVVNIAFDPARGAVWYGLSGTWKDGTASSASSATILAEIEGSGTTHAILTGFSTSDVWFPMISMYATSAVNDDLGTARFNEADFGTAAPSGYVSQNTSNLDTPTILDGTANFQTTLYTGTGAIRNLDQTGNSKFQPDMVWIKNRSAADSHMLVDAARGVTKEIFPDAALGQDTDSDGVGAFSDKTWIDASGETLIGDMTSAGGLAAAFDGDTVQGYASSAQDTTSPGYCGVDWGSGNTKVITQMITFGSSDFGYSNPGRTINIKLEGSTDNFVSSTVDLGGGTGDFTDTTTDQAAKIITPTSTTAYRYHRAKITTSVGSTHFAQLMLFEDTTTTRQGFTLGNGPAGYNDNTENFVAWQWKAGGGAGSSNEAGTINTTTTTVNTTAGLSISTYVGTGAAATVGHGLGVVPVMIMARNLDAGESWRVYHVGNTDAPETERLQLDHDHATVDASTAWNDTMPTSTVFSLGSGSSANQSTKNHVAYCFADVEGYSRFSNYTGNGDADGAYIWTGFKPAWVMIKKTTGTGNWDIYDSQRSPYNEIDDQLVANDPTAETTGSEEIDFLSNGFKIRTADSDVNSSGGNYVYAAFAKYPFGGTDVTPATTF
jgi:hypothetical protein